MMITSGAFLTTNDATMKWLTQDLPVRQIIFMRGFLVMVPLVLIAWRGGGGQGRASDPQHPRTGGERRPLSTASLFIFVTSLSLMPLADAIVLSIDDTSHSQARDRTQPGLPLKKGRGATMTHDYKRNGTTMLFASLTMLDGTIIGQHASRHRYQAFLRFLNRIAHTIPAGVPVHAILDNDATHKHKDVQVWLARHPRWTFHFTLHLKLVAKRARRRLRQADTTPSQIRRLPLRTRTPGCHPLRHRRPQHHRSQALRLDRRSRYHHRHKKKRVPNLGINPLRNV